MKKFTLEEAQGMLPLVEALLQRATETALEVDRLERKAALLRVRIFHSGGLSVDFQMAFRDAAERRKQQTEATGALAELESLGVVVSDLIAGIVDFPCEMNGETVLLCWQRGEAAITHWHGMDEDFSTRQKIDARFGRSPISRKGDPSRLN